MSSIKDKIRSATLGKSKFKSEVVDYEGVQVEIRQSTIGGRSEVFDKCRNEDGSVDSSKALVWFVIKNTYVPGTNELVFEDEDYDAMAASPTGGFIDKFGTVASKLMGAEDDEKK